MRKILSVSLFFVMLFSIASAEVLIGARQSGMGGTGVASAVGLSAVAYNPAGILKGPRGEFLLSLGAASQGLDQIANSFSKANDPAQFMVDNFGNDLSANGSLSGILGFNFNHLGVSLLVPGVNAALNKSAGSLAGSVNAVGTSALVLTLGRSFSTPMLPFASLDVGTNLKAINAASGTLTIVGTPIPLNPVTATQTIWQGSGMGFDLGAKASLDIPMLSNFSLGIALRNLSQSISYKPKSRTDTYSVAAIGDTPTVTKGTEVEGAETTANYPTSTVIGAAGSVPGIGLNLAMDIESISGGTGALAAASDTITHIGAEYPLMLGAMVLRAGVASGQNVSLTTIGAKINVPLFKLELTNIIDGKNSKNTSYVVDVGVAF